MPLAVLLPSSQRADLDGLFRERPVNDQALGAAEQAHRSVMQYELRTVGARLLLRLARGALSAEVWVPSPTGPARQNLFELLTLQRRLLVVGGRASGKTALAKLLASKAAERDLGFGSVVPIVIDGEQLGGSNLDDAEIGRQNPVLGARGVQSVMATGRGLVIVDGLDEAASPDALKASLAALGGKYPASRIVVTSRPLPPKIAGKPETVLDGFLAVRMAAPEAAPLASITELDEHDLPARWAERVAADVRSRLDLWAADRLAPGSMLARLTGRGKQLIVEGIALHLQDARAFEISETDLVCDVRAELIGAQWFADTEQLLHEEERPKGGEPVANREAVAKALVEDIRQHPGVLEEKRPGVFGFVNLAVQQYLTATFFAFEGHVRPFVEVRDDPWWQGVVILAASLDAPWSAVLPARRLLRALLDASASAGSVTTFLAARCAEVARYVPVSMRKEIEARLRATVPPRSNLEVAHLVDDIGDVAAPALLAALRAAGPNERAFTATTLGRLRHPSAMRILANLVHDEELATEAILCWVWRVDAFVKELPVGFFAFAALFNLALVNPTALRIFDDVLPRASATTLDAFIRLVARKLLRDFQRGVEDEPERDSDRVEELFEKVLAMAGKGHR
jgi:hypothetical protein